MLSRRVGLRLGLCLATTGKRLTAVPWARNTTATYLWDQQRMYQNS